MTPRKFFALVAACLLLLVACTDEPQPPDNRGNNGVRNGNANGTPTAIPKVLRPYRQVACQLPREWLLRIWRGYMPGRSGELQILPKLPNIVGAGLPHVGPWDFLERVPMFWYGPGQIAARGRVDRPVTSADIAPTQAELLGFDGFRAPDGNPMEEAIAPDRDGPPKLIVTVIWDGAGRNVLAEWPNDWPNLQRLIPEGAWFENATVGSSPTSSAQIHATIGTGAFPRNHGLVGHSVRYRGEIVAPWRSDPNLLIKPTLGDVYDRATGNRPVVGGLGTASIQLGFLGHGAAFEGGDRDIAVLREAKNAVNLAEEGFRWNLDRDFRRFFTFPEYVNGLEPLSRYADDLDAEDGERDGRWRGHDLDDPDEMLLGFNSPARVPYQTRLVEEVIRREGFGEDDVPDLLFVNFKLIDYVGHIWTLNSGEMKDSVAAQDRHLPELIETLNRVVGEGEWAMVLTSDHGSTPDPAITGAFRISYAGAHNAIQSFDRDDDDVPVAITVKPTEAYVDVAELRENGFTLADVADRVARLTQAETAVEGQEVPNPDERVYRTAFPSIVLTDLPCLPQTRRSA